jgi:hypothetical protein
MFASSLGDELARGDTVAARARLMSLLPTHQPSLAPSSFFRRSAVPPLLNVLGRLRADDDLVPWARGIRDPVVRAAALLTVGEAVLARARADKVVVISNGPDMCRGVF